MAETMANRPFNMASMSQSHRDITDGRYHDLRRPRKVKFFCNGDRFFKGMKLNITPNRYLTFNDLLSDLTGKLPTGTHLPYGVRSIYTPVAGKRIRDIEQLQDGESYVCAGFETFKAIKYGNNTLEPWSTGRPHNHDSGLASNDFRFPGSFATQPSYNRGYYGAFRPGRHLRQTYPYRGQYGATGTFGSRAGPTSYWGSSHDESQRSMRPKVVTVIRNGKKPRTNVKILLNRRSVQSYEQLMKDIAEAFGPKWKNDKVVKLFTIKGKEVQSVSDFFREEDVFVGVGRHETLTTGDVQDIIEELYPDSPYAKNLVKEWEKSKRKNQRVHVVKQGGEDGKDEAKRDSGFGSDSSNKGDGDDILYKGRPANQKKKKKYPYANEPELVVRIEEQRGRAAEDERERARKRMAKKLQSERKALEDDRRKRGLVSLKGSQDSPRSKQTEGESGTTGEFQDDESERTTHRTKKETPKVSPRRDPEEAAEPKVIVVVKGQDEKGQKSKVSVNAKKDKEREDSDVGSPRKTPAKHVSSKDHRTSMENGHEENDHDQVEKRQITTKKDEKDKKGEAEKAKKKHDGYEADMDDDDKWQGKDVEQDKHVKSKPKPKAEENNNESKTDEDENKNKVKPQKDTGKGTKDEDENKNKTAETRITDNSQEDENKNKKPGTKLTDHSQEDKENSPKDTDKGTKTSVKDKQGDKKDTQIKDSSGKEKEPKEKKKSKGIIKKTKLERQISNVDHVLDKYEVGKTLGDGNFALVKQCRLKATGAEYAMKIIDKSKLKGKEHMIENEIEIMKACNHPNIVKLVEEFETREEIYLIMELVKGGDLFDAITQSVKFGEHDSACMVGDLTSALFYLHSRNIVHRDLKPENLLVCRNKDGSISLKLADFGLAMEVKESIYTVCGTPTYVAPEILSEIGYGLEVDMWAVGVISYILLCGFPPFRSPDRNQTELFEFIKAGEYEFLKPYWDNISETAKNLIERLLVVEKRKRYTSTDVLCHPWIITQGGAVQPPDNLEEHRRNLRKVLESQAQTNRANYKNRKG